jgi:ACS family glucarate transporter-like MFS transporter
MNGIPSPASGPAAPTRVRYGVLAFASVLAMITYLDRACIAQVAPYMQGDFSLSDKQWGSLMGAFMLAYALFEIPSGWMGDVFGPRRTLLRIVIWWSFFTALTGTVYPTPDKPWLAFGILLAVNFLFGMGEAGAFPNIARTFHNWFPVSERGFAQGTVWMSARLAAGLTPLVVLFLIYGTPTEKGGDGVHWRHAFWIFGSLGLVWGVAFWTWFRDRPDLHPAVNAAELAHILGRPAAAATIPPVEVKATVQETRLVTEPAANPTWLPPEEEVDAEPPSAPIEPSHANIPWLRMVSSGNLWALCGMYFCSTYGWYFVMFWLLKFLTERYGFSKETHGVWTMGLLAGAPLLLGATACLLGGLLTDFFIRWTGNRKWGRRLFGMLGHGTCALCYFGGLLVFRANGPAWMFVLAIALAAWCNDLTMGASWASCLDIGRRYSGIISGCMNTIGNLGGAVASFCTGLILEECQNRYGKEEGKGIGWQVNLLMYAIAYLLSVAFWSVFNATKPVVDEEH